MPQLVCRNLTLGYDGKAVTEGLNFTVESGDYLCIVGDNGSGKSTLIKTLLGLLPPISGEIQFGDGLSKNEIGYLPQQITIQRNFPAHVREIVLSGCLSKGNRPFYSREDKQLAEKNMARMEISDLSKKCFRELSGGQKQRVLLARALCATEKMLLLDEPVSGLDPKVSLQMYELIKTLNREDGITIIMISHDIRTAINDADHILHIGQKNIFFGTRAEYEESPEGRAFLSEEKNSTLSER